jgi:undecaprenyl-diphosphatase
MALTAGRRIAGAAACSAALALLAAQARTDSRMARADQAAFACVRARRTRAGIGVARSVSALAEPAVVYPAVAFASVLAAPRVGWRRACLPVLTVASGAAARRGVSRVVARPRPPAGAWLVTPEGYSLPSRHTTLAALGAGACLRALGAGRPLARTATVLAASGVGASRIYLGVHWPGDVVAGWLFADGWLRLADP